MKAIRIIQLPVRTAALSREESLYTIKELCTASSPSISNSELRGVSDYGIQDSGEEELIELAKDNSPVDYTMAANASPSNESLIANDQVEERIQATQQDTER